MYKRCNILISDTFQTKSLRILQCLYLFKCHINIIQSKQCKVLSVVTGLEIHKKTTM